MQKWQLDKTNLQSLERQAVDSASEHAASILRVVEYIDRNYAQDISLQQLATIVNFSPCYLSKLFKKELDIGFLNYLTCVRLENARSLLINTPNKIGHIANMVGIKKASRFSALFLQRYGMHPKEYRQAWKQAEER